MSAGAAGAAGAAAAAVVQAIKASGVIVRVEPDVFVGILERQPGALVVHATGGFFSTNYKYLTSYKGLAFFTKATRTNSSQPRFGRLATTPTTNWRRCSGKSERRPRFRDLTVGRISWYVCLQQRFQSYGVGSYGPGAGFVAGGSGP